MPSSTKDTLGRRQTCHDLDLLLRRLCYASLHSHTTLCENPLIEIGKYLQRKSESHASPFPNRLCSQVQSSPHSTSDFHPAGNRLMLSATGASLLANTEEGSNERSSLSFMAKPLMSFGFSSLMISAGAT